MIISIALFIVITNFFFPKLSRLAEHPHPGAAGAVLYTAGAVPPDSLTRSAWSW